jgi:hypothetical protein
MISNFVSYSIDLLTNVELNNSHSLITELKAEANIRYNEVAEFFVLHFGSTDDMNIGKLYRSYLEFGLVLEGKQLINKFFTYLIQNKITKLDVYPHGLFCDVTLHWINHILGYPECAKQKNLFTLTVSPNVNWYSKSHSTSLWDLDLEYASVTLNRILKSYIVNQQLFVVRKGTEELFFENPEQVVSFLVGKIKEYKCLEQSQTTFKLVGNQLQTLDEFNHNGIHTSLVNVSINY